MIMVLRLIRVSRGEADSRPRQRDEGGKVLRTASPHQRARSADGEGVADDDDVFRGHGGLVVGTLGGAIVVPPTVRGLRVIAVTPAAVRRLFREPRDL